MAVTRSRILIVVAVTAAGVAMLAAPGLCVELRLAGAAIGDAADEILASASFGTPDGMFSAGNVFNSTKAAPGAKPPWARAVAMARLAPGQVEWVYNRDPVSVGIVITGKGINAHVTDITVSMWRDFKPSKLAQTAKGVQLGTSFADVLERYGWPNRLEIIAEAGQTQAAAGRAARPQAPGAARRVGGLGVRRLSFGRRRAPTTSRGARRSAQRIRIGVRPLPSVGPGVRVPGAAAPARAANTTVAAVGQTPNLTFTKSCIISYPSVDFVVYRMKVFRIHIYGR